jgi:hypothetical protein
LLWWSVVGWLYYRRPEWAWARHWRVWISAGRYLPPLGQFQPAAARHAAWLIVLIAWLAVLGWGLGRRCLKRSALSSGDAVLDGALGAAVGWGLLGLAMLVLGLLHLWDSRLLFGSLAIGSAALAAEYFLAPRPALAPPPPRTSKKAPKPAPPAEQRWTAWDVAFAALLAILLAFNAFTALSPETFYDALVYHLALPDLYWKHGGIVALPQNLYSGLPQLIHLLYGVALPLGGDALARAWNWSFGAGVVVLLYALGRRFAGRTAGLLAAVLFYSLPWASLLNWRTGVELGWAFFELAAFSAACVHLIKAEESRRWVLLSGALAGLAMGCKYQAWPLLGVLAAALAAASPGDRGRRFKTGALFAAAAAAVAAPWCVKNLILYRNPIYPFFQDGVASDFAPRWRALLADGGGRDWAFFARHPAEWIGYLRHPWDVTFGSPEIGPTLLLAVPVLLLCRFEAPLFLIWSGFLGLWLIATLSSTIFRFWVPHAPEACLLLAVAVEALYSGRLRGACRAGALFVCACGAVHAMAAFQIGGAAAAILGTQPEGDYLRSARAAYAVPPYSAIEFVNRSLPSTARILFLGEARGYYCRPDYVATTILDDYPLPYWLRRSRDASELRDFFVEGGVTHVLYNPSELVRWQSGASPFLPADPRSARIFEEFTRRYLRSVFLDSDAARGNGTTVFEFVPAGR